MLDQFWQRLLPYQMTRIQEPDLLIDHDSGGRGERCKRFLGGSLVEPFAYSGVNTNNENKLSSGGSMGKWFPFSPPRMKKPVDVSFDYTSSSSTSLPSSLSSSLDDRPTIVVHNNNNNLGMLDENTRWSSSSSSTASKTQRNISCNNNNNNKNKHPPILPPPCTAVLPNGGGLHLGSTTKSKNISINNKNSNKFMKHGKNSNSSNNSKNSSSENNKNNCGSNNTSNSNSNSCKKSSTNNGRMNNCATTPMPTTTAATHINVNTSSSHQNRSNGEDEDSGARHLIVRYIQCNERPNKKQLVTLGLISVVFLIILIILLSLFLSPTRTFVGSVNGNNYNSEISDAFISSDITSSLNNDDVDLDDSDSYDDEGDTPYYSSTSSSNSNNNSELDLKKVSKLSWDLLNSNQDASSRGSGGSSSNSRSTSSISSNSNKPSDNLQPLTSVSGDGEIILPAKMIYTSSGDSTDLMPSENVGGTGTGGSQNKKRSCCRTQKYSQVIKRDGCEPLTIVNKMCFGQCVSVWVPGLFASFPVCRPSKSTFKTVTLTCGRNREKRKRVRIEKVRRCSCMEIEPTAASL